MTLNWFLKKKERNEKKKQYNLFLSSKADRDQKQARRRKSPYQE